MNIDLYRRRFRHMTILGITGLHAAGKSYMLERIPKEFGFTVYNKKEVIADICEMITGVR